MLCALCMPINVYVLTVCFKISSSSLITFKSQLNIEQINRFKVNNVTTYCNTKLQNNKETRFVINSAFTIICGYRRKRAIHIWRSPFYRKRRTSCKTLHKTLSATCVKQFPPYVCTFGESGGVPSKKLQSLSGLVRIDTTIRNYN